MNCLRGIYFCDLKMVVKFAKSLTNINEYTALSFANSPAGLNNPTPFKSTGFTRIYVSNAGLEFVRFVVSPGYLVSG